jgi:hypothetical protein
MAQLEKVFARIQRRNSLLSSTLQQTLELLSSQGIRALTFKGPTLAVAAYGDLALREFTDLDIFIPPDDARRVRKALCDHGYSPYRFVKGRVQRVPAESMRDELVFIDSGGTVLLDIHTELMPPQFGFQLDFDQTWNRRRYIGMDGNPLPTFDNTDLLLFLCVHGCKHRWRRLNWVCDVAALLRLPSGIDDTEALGRAKRLRCLRRLLVGLLVSNELLGSHLPKIAARPGRERRSLQQVVDRSRAIFAPWEVRTIADAYSQIVFHFRCAESWNERCQILTYYVPRLSHTLIYSTERLRESTVLPHRL